MLLGSNSGRSGGYSYSSNSFIIFSLINKEGLAPFKSKVNSPNTQFTEAQVMVLYLAKDMRSESAIMPTLTLVHTQTFITATTKYQVEYRTGKQSFLGLINSHLMIWRCSISPESHETENR